MNFNDLFKMTLIVFAKVTDIICNKFRNLTVPIDASFDYHATTKVLFFTK